MVASPYRTIGKWTSARRREKPFRVSTPNCVHSVLLRDAQAIHSMPVDRSLPQAQGGAPESDLSVSKHIVVCAWRAHAVQASIAEASQHKDCGNALFKARDWEGAATEYLVGLAKLPPRPPARKSNEAKGKARAEGERPDEDAPTPAASEPLEDTPEEQEHEEPVECRTLRAVLYANVAACRAKLGDDKAVVDLCSQGAGYMRSVASQRLTLRVQHCWTIRITRKLSIAAPPQTSE